MQYIGFSRPHLIASFVLIFLGVAVAAMGVYELIHFGLTGKYIIQSNQNITLFGRFMLFISPLVLFLGLQLSGRLCRAIRYPNKAIAFDQNEVTFLWKNISIKWVQINKVSITDEGSIKYILIDYLENGVEKILKIHPLQFNIDVIELLQLFENKRLKSQL